MQRLILLILLLSLTLPITVSQAQDTPPSVRETAIQAVNRVFAIGRPDRWEHVETTATDSNLGCALLPVGQPLGSMVFVYQVTLFYGDTPFTYYISSDFLYIVACDPKILDPSSFDPQTILQSSCTPELQAAIKLKVGDLATVNATQANVRFRPEPLGSLLGTLTRGNSVQILSGPICHENLYAYWLVSYTPEGSQGYMVEVDFTVPTSPIYALVAGSGSAAPNTVTVAPTVAPVAAPITSAPVAPPPTTAAPVAGVPATLGGGEPIAGTVLPPNLTLPTTRPPFALNNMAQIVNVGELLFPDSIVQVDSVSTGRIAVFVRGMGLKNNVIFYDSLNSGQLTPVAERALSGNDGSYLSLSSTGVYALTTTDPATQQNAISIYNTNGGAVVSNQPVPTSLVYQATFNKDGSFLAYSYTEATGANHLVVVNLGFNTSKDIPLTEALTDMVFSSDGSLLAGMSAAGNIYLWDGRSLAPKPTLTTGLNSPSNRIGVSPTGDKVAVGGQTGVVQVWSTTNSAKLFDLTIYPPTDPTLIGEIAFNPDGTLLATGGYRVPLVDNAGNNVLIFDANTGQQVATLQGMQIVLGLAFSPLGDFLIGYDEYALHLWGIKPQ